MRLSGQTALVTGASRGIGLAIARELSRHGAQVAMVARDRTELEKAAASVNEEGGGRAAAHPADVRDYEAITVVVAAVERDLGPISALVNNAGTGGPAGLEWEVDPDAWWECIESIVRGAFNCTRAVVPAMVARGGGRVIDVASVTGTTPWPLVSATSVAKTALIRHTENLAAAGSEAGIRVFALHPGMVRTQLLLSYRSDPSLREFLDTAPEEAFSPPELSGAVVARIVAGDLDAYSGRFVDATVDLDDVAGAPHGETLTLRLVGP
jgi:NAD(P)-dependent dehydrogenase (short-subunit alcohol dehydrogenase family)